MIKVLEFTSLAFLKCLEERNIQISIDGREKSYDNTFIERLWRLLKYEEVYINNYETVGEAKKGISSYMSFYNRERPHQSLGYRTPA
ncbi:transposase [Candidatus Aerophobetes bacterium]|nr:transposase [Candidatus Aerophobetes bacterium]